MPEGVSVTVGDLWLPQDAYQARVAFVVPVLCGWAEQYAAGNDAALDRATRQRVLAGHAGDGERRSTTRRVVAEDVELLAGDRHYEGYRHGWGC